MGAAGIILIAGGAQAGLVDAVRAGVFAILLVVLALAAVMFTGRMSATVTRSGPHAQLVAGDTASVGLTVRRSRGLALAESILSEPNTYTSGVTRVPLTAPEHRVGYDVSVPHRGVLRSGPASIETQDALGLAYRTLPVPGEGAWTVWPRTRDSAAPRPWAQGFEETNGASTHPVHQGEPGAGTRAYVRGDDLRLVHWPATARRGELIVRQLDPPVRESLTLTLVGHVDEVGVEPTWESLIEECASTLEHAHENGLPFVITVGDVRTGHHDEAMDALAEASNVPPAAEAASLAFVHASAQALPQARTDGGAYAVITGADARELDELDDRLTESGWLVTRLEASSPLHARSTHRDLREGHA